MNEQLSSSRFLLQKKQKENPKQNTFSLHSTRHGKTETQEPGLCPGLREWAGIQRKTRMDRPSFCNYYYYKNFILHVSLMLSEARISKNGIFRGAHKSLKKCGSLRYFCKSNPNRFAGLFLKMPFLLHRFDCGPKLITQGPLKIHQYRAPGWMWINKSSIFCKALWRL